MNDYYGAMREEMTKCLRPVIDAAMRAKGIRLMIETEPYFEAPAKDHLDILDWALANKN